MKTFGKTRIVAVILTLAMLMAAMPGVAHATDGGSAVSIDLDVTQFAAEYANPAYLATTSPSALTTTPAAITPITAGIRTLRFAIDSTTFTDNGVSHTLEAAPFIANDRTMVPLRVIIEALGATNLEFDAGVITFVLSGENITMTIGQPLPDGMGTPVIIADRTFVPLRYIMDEIGATARWDGVARAAYIYI